MIDPSLESGTVLLNETVLVNKEVVCADIIVSGSRAYAAIDSAFKEVDDREGEWILLPSIRPLRIQNVLHEGSIIQASVITVENKSYASIGFYITKVSYEKDYWRADS